MIVSCQWRTSQANSVKVEGVILADSVGTLGVDFRTRVTRLGAKEKSRRKKVHSRSSRRMKSFQSATCEKEYGTNKSVESACSGDGVHRKIKN